MRAAHTKRRAGPKPAAMATANRLPPIPPMEPLALRPAAAAHALSVSERTLWTLISRGRLKVSRIGSVTLVHVDSIRGLLDEAATAAQQQ